MNSRRLVTGLALGLVLVLLAIQVRQLLRNPAVWPPDDFIEYWAAARLTLDGQNAYDPSLLFPLQVAAGRDTSEAVMMWNPPWSLTAVLPLGLLPAREAQLLWLLVNLAAVGFAGDRLWQLYGGRRDRRWLGWLIAGAFVPTLFALHAGQIGPLLLLGAVLFLIALKHDRPFLAGAATVLLAIKPHLAYLLWLAILCDAIVRRRASLLVGGAIAGIVCTLLPLTFNPQVIQQYADAMANRPPDQWVSPTLGTLLRLAFGEERFALQFVPMALGLAWFAWHWHRERHSWNWQEQTPRLLLVSFATAPYGAWPFDLVLLLPAIVEMIRKPRSLPRPVVVAALLAINFGCLAMNLLRTGSFWFLWVAPAILLLHTLAFRPCCPAKRLGPPVLETAES